MRLPLICFAALTAASIALAACSPLAMPQEPPAQKAAAQCDIPAVIAPVPAEEARAGEVNADFTPDYYLLALTWQPEQRRSKPEAVETTDRPDARWTLHGLWPNSTEGEHPRYCRPSSVISEATVRANYCATPSARLMQHEWAAHGVCAWDTPEAFFDRSRGLWERLKKPDPLDLVGADGRMTAGALRDAFVAVNPWLPREAVAIAVGSDNQLREVRVCHDLAFEAFACPGSRGTPDRVSILITR